jgi:hypothetical protein
VIASKQDPTKSATRDAEEDADADVDAEAEEAAAAKDAEKATKKTPHPSAPESEGRLTNQVANLMSVTQRSTLNPLS